MGKWIRLGLDGVELNCSGKMRVDGYPLFFGELQRGLDTAAPGSLYSSPAATSCLSWPGLMFCSRLQRDFQGHSTYHSASLGPKGRRPSGDQTNAYACFCPHLSLSLYLSLSPLYTPPSLGAWGLRPTCVSPAPSVPFHPPTFLTWQSSESPLGDHLQ